MARKSKKVKNFKNSKNSKKRKTLERKFNRKKKTKKSSRFRKIIQNKAGDLCDDIDAMARELDGNPTKDKIEEIYKRCPYHVVYVILKWKKNVATHVAIAHKQRGVGETAPVTNWGWEMAEFSKEKSKQIDAIKDKFINLIANDPTFFRRTPENLIDKDNIPKDLLENPLSLSQK